MNIFHPKIIHTSTIHYTLNWKLIKCPLILEKTTLWYIHTTWYYTIMIKNEWQLRATMWMTLINIMLSTCCVILFLQIPQTETTHWFLEILLLEMPYVGLRSTVQPNLLVSAVKVLDMRVKLPCSFKASPFASWIPKCPLPVSYVIEDLSSQACPSS